MGRNLFPVDLTAVPWRPMAAEVHYQSALLAQHWKINLRRLQREFRRQLQTTPQKHLNAVRLKEAQRLARENVRTKDICNQLEFKQASHLCRQVHLQLGTTLG